MLKISYIFSEDMRWYIQLILCLRHMMLLLQREPREIYRYWSCKFITTATQALIGCFKKLLSTSILWSHNISEPIFFTSFQRYVRPASRLHPPRFLQLWYLRALRVHFFTFDLFFSIFYPSFQCLWGNECSSRFLLWAEDLFVRQSA